MSAAVATTEPPEVLTVPEVAKTLLSYKSFAELVGATHGSVKRWVHEGMPVERNSVDPTRPRIDPTAAQAWLDTRTHRPSTTFNRSSIVYFARRADGLIKIGFTSDVDRRMREIAKEFRIKVPRVMATLPGDKRLELRLHVSFARWSAGDEWFHPAKELLAFIATIARSEAA